MTIRCKTTRNISKITTNKPRGRRDGHKQDLKDHKKMKNDFKAASEVSEMNFIQSQNDGKVQETQSHLINTQIDF